MTYTCLTRQPSGASLTCNMSHFSKIVLSCLCTWEDSALIATDAAASAAAVIATTSVPARVAVRDTTGRTMLARSGMPQ